jgi:hypothetical protein
MIPGQRPWGTWFFRTIDRRIYILSQFRCQSRVEAGIPGERVPFGTSLHGSERRRN